MIINIKNKNETHDTITDCAEGSLKTNMPASRDSHDLRIISFQDFEIIGFLYVR